MQNKGLKTTRDWLVAIAAANIGTSMLGLDVIKMVTDMLPAIGDQVLMIAIGVSGVWFILEKAGVMK